MQTCEIAKRAAKIIAEALGLSVEDISPSKTLVEDLGMDSLDVVDLVVQLETEFAIEIAYGETDDVRTVQDVVDSVKRHTNAKRCGGSAS